MDAGSIVIEKQLSRQQLRRAIEVPTAITVTFAMDNAPIDWNNFRSLGQSNQVGGSIPSVSDFQLVAQLRQLRDLDIELVVKGKAPHFLLPISLERLYFRV